MYCPVLSPPTFFITQHWKLYLDWNKKSIYGGLGSLVCQIRRSRSPLRAIPSVALPQTRCKYLPDTRPTDLPLLHPESHTCDLKMLKLGFRRCLRSVSFMGENNLEAVEKSSKCWGDFSISEHTQALWLYLKVFLFEIMSIQIFNFNLMACPSKSGEQCKNYRTCYMLSKWLKVIWTTGCLAVLRPDICYSLVISLTSKQIVSRLKYQHNPITEITETLSVAKSAIWYIL